MSTPLTHSPEGDELSFDTMQQKGYEQATGVKLRCVQDQVLLNVAGVAPAHEDKLDWAVQHMASLKPQDAHESMLCQQMIALNTMAMDCTKRAMGEGQTFYTRDMHIKHATRLMNTFAKVSAALDKHRGKGQTIVVKHQQVNVESGGQAIVGDVSQGLK